MALAGASPLGLLNPAPRRDAKSREILKGAGPMVWFGSWVLLFFKFLWILHPLIPCILVFEPIEQHRRKTLWFVSAFAL